MCPIVHIHGQLGYLPWQIKEDTTESDGTEKDTKENCVPYNVITDTREKAENITGRKDTSYLLDTMKKYLDNAGEGIKVIHEATEETDELIQAREWIRGCRRLYFLGFGYHPTNVERLQISSISPQTKILMGTAYGLNYERYESIGEMFLRLGPAHRKKDILFRENVYTFLHDNVSLTT